MLPGKVNEEHLTPGDLRQIMAFTKAHGRRPGPFDVAVYGFTPCNPQEPAKIVQPWIDAGATWWREGIGDGLGPLKKARARIRSGPPTP